ncbi:MAG: endonuclease III [Clostridia bacterium]|nr:endonuclease III [Clostridia bacterium]
MKSLKTRLDVILRELTKLYPEARPELTFSNPFETLIATMLSAQCTDKRVNMVTATLFQDYPDAESMSKVPLDVLEERIKPCGLYHMKAKHILEACQAICEQYGGNVPQTREELTRLPGVGNKTAAVVAMAAYGADVLPVDTHVFRLAHRLDLVKDAKTPDEVERQLTAIVPQGERAHMHHLLIWHGRRMCKAIKPDCAACPLHTGACNYDAGKKQ